ncbi:MAG: hypothetical protein M3331_01960 [Actinomycetota bacterium]|nr:hypothetical protein [Actinomycetota bacterium]
MATYDWLAHRRGAGVARSVALLNTAGAALRWLGLTIAVVAAPARFRPQRDHLSVFLRVHWARLLRLGRSDGRRRFDS